MGHIQIIDTQYSNTEIIVSFQKSNHSLRKIWTASLKIIEFEIDVTIQISFLNCLEF